MLPPFAIITPLPGSLALQSGTVEGGRPVLEARGVTERESWPVCGRPSGSVHSVSGRALHDRPAHGRAV